MATADDWRHICLLLAAFEGANEPTVSQKGTRAIKRRTRFALYLLVAISMWRRGLTRRDLRHSAAGSNQVPSSRIRFGTPNSAFRMRMLARLDALPAPLPHKQGCLSIAYQ